MQSCVTSALCPLSLGIDARSCFNRQQVHSEIAQQYFNPHRPDAHGAEAALSQQAADLDRLAAVGGDDTHIRHAHRAAAGPE